jgi:hypothetical protein
MGLMRNPKDLLAGLMFMAFGVAALVISQSYTLGTAARMGPGYFPRLLGILLVGLGAVQVLLSFRANSAAERPEWHWRPLFIVLVGVGTFIVVAPAMGVMVAGLVLVFISSWASSEFRFREALISGVVQGIAAVVVFVYGLGLPLPVWPTIIGGGQ